MKNEIPAIRNNNEMVFTRLGEAEDLDLTLTRQPDMMKVERLAFNDETGDWESKEVDVVDVQEELSEYTFSTVTRKPLSYKQLQTMFTFRRS